MAKVMEMVRLTLMPMSWAAPRSSEQARMALPILVFEVKSVRATMMTTHTPTVTSITPETFRRPRNSGTSKSTREVKFLGVAPQMSWAAFWRK